MPVFGDIRELVADSSGKRLCGRGENENGQQPSLHREDFQSIEIDLLTGGFPCQPFSQAGKRRGTDDSRYLWPEMLECIKLFKLRWVVAENVRGILSIEGGLVFEQVCSDLEKADYEVQPFVIPACAVNAPHRRDRVWIVAHRTGRREWGSGESGLERLDEGENSIGQPQEGFGLPDRDAEWDRSRREVALATCVRPLDDGLPKRLVRFPDGTSISESGWRRECLKMLGNSIVPQVAVEIMKAIREADREARW